MRLKLVIHRHGVPSCYLTWITNALGHFSSEESHRSATVSEFLATVNDVVPLESGEWGLEDYIVEVDGRWECLHFQEIGNVFRDGDEVQIRPLTSGDLKNRRRSGRHQITKDGKRLQDGVVFGRKFIKATADRPAVEIPPRKRARLTIEDGDYDNEDTTNYDHGQQLILAADFDDAESDDEDFELSNYSTSEWESESDSESTTESIEENQDEEEERSSSSITIVEKKQAQELPLISENSLARKRTRVPDVVGHNIQSSLTLNGVLRKKGGQRASSDSESIRNVHFEETTIAPPSKKRKRSAPSEDNHEAGDLYDGSSFKSKELSKSKESALKKKLSPSSSLKVAKSQVSIEKAVSGDNTDDEDSTSSSGSSSISSSDSDSSSDDSDADDATSSSESGSSDVPEDEPSSEESSDDEPVQKSRAKGLGAKNVKSPNVASQSKEQQKSTGGTKDGTHEQNSIEKPQALALEAVALKSQQPNVPPGCGSKATHKRRLRIQRKKRFSRLQADGLLPPDADYRDWVSKEYPQENAGAKNLAHGTETPLNAKEELEKRRNDLLSAIESGGIEVDPVAKSFSSNKASFGDSVSESAVTLQQEPNHAQADTDYSEEKNLSENRPGPRMRLDIASSRRMLFGSLGIRAPKDTKASQAKDGRSTAKVEPAHFPNDAAHSNGTNDSYSRILPDVDEVEANNGQLPDLDSWRSKITLSAVECGDEEVVLSAPPFPFVQRWDPQQQIHRQSPSQGAKGSKRKARRKSQNSKLSKSENQIESHDSEEKEIVLDYDESMTQPQSDESDEVAAAVNSQILRDVNAAAKVNNNESSMNAMADLPPLPQNPQALPDLAQSDLVEGSIIAFKRLVMTKSYQPEMSNYVTAQVLESSGNDGECTIRLARRDVVSTEGQFNKDTGERIYRKFEMPGMDEDDETSIPGQEVISFSEMIDPKLVQASNEILKNDVEDPTEMDRDSENQKQRDNLEHSLSVSKAFNESISNSQKLTSEGVNSELASSTDKSNIPSVDGASDPTKSARSLAEDSSSSRNGSSPVPASPKFNGLDAFLPSTIPESFQDNFRPLAMLPAVSRVRLRGGNSIKDEGTDEAELQPGLKADTSKGSSSPDLAIVKNEPQSPPSNLHAFESVHDDEWYNPRDDSSFVISISSAEVADQGNQEHEHGMSPFMTPTKACDLSSPASPPSLAKPDYSTSDMSPTSKTGLKEWSDGSSFLDSSTIHGNSNRKLGYDASTLPTGSGWADKRPTLKMTRSIV